jgi:hypothetical protein
VPGFLALACLPFPFLFYKYGATVRAKSKWSVKAEKMLAAMMAGNPAAKKAPTDKVQDPAEEADPNEVVEVRERESDRAQAEADDYPPTETSAESHDGSRSQNTLTGGDENAKHAAKK